MAGRPEHAEGRAVSRDDRDLASVQEARTLARRAKTAASALAELSQAQIDAIVDAMAAAATPQAEALARLAHEETGYGVVADKVQKNLFASENVYRFIKPIKTVGVIQRIDDRKVIEIDEPDLDRDLQDSDRGQGALPNRHQSPSSRGPLYYPRC
jgi:acyl-CoA reductase-like NAD-dependent aldehyde dehydrogenase